MSVLYVARSAKLSEWASDVGLSKHVYKIGCTDEPLEGVIAAGWAGETDWTLVRKRDVDDVTEEEIIARLQRKDKMIDPNYYPRLRGATGLFKVLTERVENHLFSARALAGEPLKAIKVKPTDFADYLIHNVLR